MGVRYGARNSLIDRGHEDAETRLTVLRVTGVLRECERLRMQVARLQRRALEHLAEALHDPVASTTRPPLSAT